MIEDADTATDRRIAWVSLGFAMWLILGVALVGAALQQGLTTDAGWSWYHVPAYAGLVTLVGYCLARLVRARSRGGSWRSALPPGYGVLGAGAVVLLAFVVVDIGWREGVGIAFGIEGSLAPSRVVLVAGLVLVSLGPLRVALVSGATSRTARWAATLSAALVLGVLWIPGGYHPAQAAWIERAPVSVVTAAEVWRMNADGTGQTRTIPSIDGTEASGPAWSPDGTRFVYTLSHPRDDGGTDLDVWIANADGTGRRPLVEGPEWDWIPRWSPDGRWITFTREAQGGPGMAAGPVPPDAGGGPLGPGFDLEPTSLRQFADIWRVAADGASAPEPLTDAPGDDRAGSWSPDGTRLVFDSTRDGDTELYVMDADGSDQQRLTHDAADDWGESWSPDGTRIAFNSDRTGLMQIYTIAPDGSDLQRLTHDDVETVTPAWSPDGSRIAYSRRGDDVEIWTMARDGSDAADLSASPASDDSVWDDAWGPTGELVYTRSAFAPVTSDRLVRQDLASAGVLIAAATLAAVAALVAVFGAPFGGFALIMGVATALAASASGEWRFVLPAVLAGLAVDVLTRLLPARHRVAVAGAASGAALVLAAAAAVAATSGLGWSATLLIGVTALCALAGYLIGAIVAWAHPASA